MASPTEPTKRFKKISRNDGWVTAAAPLSKQPDNSGNPPKNQGRVKNTSCFSLQPQREFTLSVLRLDNGSLDPGTKATTWSSHRRKVQTLGNDFGQFLEGFLRWRLLCSDVHFPLRCFEDILFEQGNSSANCIAWHQKVLIKPCGILSELVNKWTLSTEPFCPIKNISSRTA